MSIEGQKVYLCARPVSFSPSCMHCHGRPEQALQELLQRYGAKRFFFPHSKQRGRSGQHQVSRAADRAEHQGIHPVQCQEQVWGVLTIDNSDLIQGESGTGKELAARVMEDFTRAHVQDILKKTRGNVSQAARMSGLERVSLQKILRRLRIDSESYREDI